MRAVKLCLSRYFTTQGKISIFAGPSHPPSPHDKTLIFVHIVNFRRVIMSGYGSEEWTPEAGSIPCVAGGGHLFPGERSPGNVLRYHLLVDDITVPQGHLRQKLYENNLRRIVRIFANLSVFLDNLLVVKRDSFLYGFWGLLHNVFANTQSFYKSIQQQATNNYGGLSSAAQETCPCIPRRP